VSSLLAVFVFILGAIAGSFLNVIIHRYPLHESIVFPPSRCPDCQTPIRWYDNIPLLSYFVLRGRCRHCRSGIAPRYLLVELANALFYLALYLRTGPTIGFLMIAAIVSMTIALIFIDLDIQILPDVIDLPGLAIGLGAAALGAVPFDSDLSVAATLQEAIIGAVAGAGVLLAIGAAYKLVRRIEGMGLGDVKMMAMIGAVGGWRAIPAVLLLASVAGAAVGVPVALRSGRGMQLPLPFGVFLGLAFLAVLFFGPTLWSWYLSVLPR
jgi:leader peptidase (prepilin peptidase)/N-methyltransferase